LVDRHVACGPVDLAGRGVDELRDVRLARGLQEIERAGDVGGDVAVGRHVGIGDRDQRGEVEDDLHVLAELAREMAVAEVAAHHLDAVAAAGILEPAPAVERVVLDERAHARALIDQHLGEMRTDEAVRTGDEDALVGDRVHATARITRATLSKISAVWLSLTISGGVSASVSPLFRIITPSSWDALAMAS